MNEFCRCICLLYFTRSNWKEINSFYQIYRSKPLRNVRDSFRDQRISWIGTSKTMMRASSTRVLLNPVTKSVTSKKVQKKRKKEMAKGGASKPNERDIFSRVEHNLRGISPLRNPNWRATCNFNFNVSGCAHCSSS